MAEWLRSRGVVFLHVANEGRRSLAGGAIMRRMGLSAGVPDYLILTRTAMAPHGAFIELKRRHGGRVSPAQADWHARLVALGWAGGVAAGAREAVDLLVRLGY